MKKHELHYNSYHFFTGNSKKNIKNKYENRKKMKQ